MRKLAEKKRYTFSFTEDTAEKFEELVKFYSIQKSGVVTLLIREAYEKNIDRKDSEQNKRKLAFLVGYEFSLTIVLIR